jgi:mannitol/fructose-specific phosphotransferase system IIA component (Ntr-type)
VSAIADYTAPELLLPEPKGVTAADVIAELVEALERAGRLTDRASFLEAVLAREKMSPTYLPIGWATPHARLQNLPQLSFALARPKRPLPWIGLSKTLVKLIWLFAVPEQETRAYLTLIASMARLSKDTMRIERLLLAPDALAMCDVLKEVHLQRPHQPEPASDPGLVRSLV